MIALHGIRGRENAGRMLDVAVRIQPPGRESHERGHHPGSETHARRIVRYSSRHAARVHQNARPRQRLHRVRSAARWPPADRRAMARALRAPHRHRLRPGAGDRAAAPRRHRRSTTGSSTPTAARWSNAATACVASPRSCIVAARAGNGGGELVLDSPAGLIRARIHDANLDLRRHGRRPTSTPNPCHSKPRRKRTSIRSPSRAPKWRSARYRWAIRTPCSPSPRWPARRWTGSGPPSRITHDSRSA